MKIVSACFVLVDKVLLQLRTPTNNKSFIVRVVKVCKRLIKWAMHAMHDNNCILSLWVISKSVNIRFDSILFYVWHSCGFCFEAKTSWKGNKLLWIGAQKWLLPMERCLKFLKHPAKSNKRTLIHIWPHFPLKKSYDQPDCDRYDLERE